GVWLRAPHCAALRCLYHAPRAVPNSTRPRSHELNLWTVFVFRRWEVNYESSTELCRLEIRACLCKVVFRYLGSSLQLEHQSTLDDEVQSMESNSCPSVEHLYVSLNLIAQAKQPKFDRHCIAVDLFHKARTKFCVDPPCS